MHPVRSVDISTETVFHQGDTVFFTELTELVKILKETSLRNNKIVLGDIAQCIKKHTGLSINPSVVEGEVGVYIMPPDLNKNHALYAGIHDGKGTAATLTNALKRGFKLDSKGEIDLVKGKVSGVFSQIVSELVISKDFLSSYYSLSPAQLAAILLHEVGHVFTYFECLVETTATNHVLTELNEVLKGNDDKSLKVQLIIATENMLDVKYDNHDLLADGKVDLDYLQVPIAQKYTIHPLSEYDSHLLDSRNWEHLADQYAARMGAGKDLTFALDRLYKLQGDGAYSSSTSMMLSKVFISLTLFPVICLLLGISVIFGIDPHVNVYDKPRDRIIRVRNQLVNKLKKKRINKKESLDFEKVISDIDEISKVLSGMKNNTSILEDIFSFFSSAKRQKLKRAEEMQLLENLANNDLYVSSVKFKQLK